MPLSIISHYYNNSASVEKAVAAYREISRLHPEMFEFVLIDDHSHEPISQDLFEGIPSLRVFRILEDVAWNMPAARNIGVSEARFNKLLIMDIDHMVDLSRFDLFLSDVEALKIGEIARFRRKRRSLTNQNEWIEIRSHMNSFLIHKSDFVDVGGYEEEFSGHYGQEDKFFTACCRKNGIAEVMLDSYLVLQGKATSNLVRDKTVNADKLDSILKEKTFRASKYLTYKWTQIYPISSRPLEA